MSDSSRISSIEPNPNFFNLNLIKPPPPPTKFCGYICNRCSKVFSSSQALGGHQNAHRREINKEKRPRKASHNSNKKRAKLQKNKQPQTEPPSDPSLDLKLTSGEETHNKFKNMWDSIVTNLPFDQFKLPILSGGGSKCRCQEKVGGSSSRGGAVARFRYDPLPDTIIFESFPRLNKNVYSGEKGGDNNSTQPLDLTLKL